MADAQIIGTVAYFNAYSTGVLANIADQSGNVASVLID
jgi:hypothetical protein